MPRDTPLAPSRSDARATHESLLVAASAAFTERGTDASYEDIAERAGVARATLYRHFPTREGLLLRLFDRLMTELEAAAEVLSERPDGLFELLKVCLEVQEHSLPIADMASQSATAEELTAMRKRFERLVAIPLVNAQAAGLVRAELTVPDVRMVIIMLSSLTRKTVTDEDRARALDLAHVALAGAPAVDPPQN